jgi:hypothetical protein
MQYKRQEGCVEREGMTKLELLMIDHLTCIVLSNSMRIFMSESVVERCSRLLQRTLPLLFISNIEYIDRRYEQKVTLHGSSDRHVECGSVGRLRFSLPCTRCWVTKKHPEAWCTPLIVLFVSRQGALPRVPDGHRINRTLLEGSFLNYPYLLLITATSWTAHTPSILHGAREQTARSDTSQIEFCNSRNGPSLPRTKI